VKVSLIIPAFNEERLIADTLGSVKHAMEAFSAGGWETELVVCDNNSTDCTAELARAAGAKVTFEPVNQIARARNRGAEAASGDWFIFVDADSKPTRELFEEVRVQISSGRCLAGGCTVRLEGNYPVAGFVIGFWNSVSKTCRWMAGSFIFCEAGAFREIGGFSNELFAGEEIDLSKRLKKLARQKHKKIIILDRHPLATSARKLHLYSLREHLWFIAKASLAPRSTVRRREACHTWYDGRR